LKILVTGGAGFIGSHLVDELIKQDHKVAVLDNLEYQVHGGKIPDYLNEDAKYIFGDIRDEDLLARILDGYDAIINLAAAVGVGQSMYQVKYYMDVNTLGTANLINTLINKNIKPKKMIVASSMSIYGEGHYSCADCGVVDVKLRPLSQLKERHWEVTCPECGKNTVPIPTPEEKTLYPTSFYAISKKDQEEMTLTYSFAYKQPVVALRFFNVYGPRQALSNPYTGAIAIFLSRLLNDNPPLIYEDGMQSRDFIHVSDIVRGIILALENDEMAGETFNVATGVRTSILDVAKELAGALGKDIEPKIAGEFRQGDIRHCYADITRIREFGFEPRVKLTEGIKELVELSKQEKPKDMVDLADKELEEKGLKD
jgi:dTDP-L-rhamnose 4-epimerase